MSWPRLEDIRRYTELVRAGDGNEPERLALLRRHEERVREQQQKLDRCLDLTRFKIGVYEDILAGDTAPAEDKASLPVTALGQCGPVGTSEPLRIVRAERHRSLTKNGEQGDERGSHRRD